EQILRWADAYHKTHGCWPRTQSGRVAGTESETWLNISMSLGYGNRGLPGGSTLCRLLAEHRGVHNPAAALDLRIEQILAWADAHRATTGRWPRASSGAVTGAPGEDWDRLNAALYRGDRGLPGGMTLSQVFGRPVRLRPTEGWTRLRVPEILAWADAHHAAT